MTSHLPLQRTRDRRGALGHMCPRCHRPWALNAAFAHPRLVVVCRYCPYERLISLRVPQPRPDTDATASG
jgi:hypothetical protein